MKLGNIENDNDAHTFTPMKKISGGTSYASVDAVSKCFNA